MKEEGRGGRGEEEEGTGGKGGKGGREERRGEKARDDSTDCMKNEYRIYRKRGDGEL